MKCEKPTDLLIEHLDLADLDRPGCVSYSGVADHLLSASFLEEGYFRPRRNRPKDCRFLRSHVGWEQPAATAETHLPEFTLINSTAPLQRCSRPAWTVESSQASFLALGKVVSSVR